ncbi:MAG: four helix bundle protein [Leeuwenhoekiella sp.]
MAHFNSFEDLEVYQLARQLAKDVWNLIQNTSLGKDYELRNQISRSAGSVMDNIAEGFGRGGNKEFINFLGFAKGSCCETKSQFIRCFDREHINKAEYMRLSTKSQNLIDQLGKFSNYLKKSEKRGSKFD